MDIAEVIVGLIAGASLISFFVERNKLGSVNEDLKDDHKNVFKMISTEHDRLSSEIKVISDGNGNLKEQQSKMETTLSFLEKREITKEAAENAMRSSRLDIEKIATQLTALSIEVSELRIENANLKADNAKLTQENTEIKEYISKIRSADFDADEEEM